MKIDTLFKYKKRIYTPYGKENCIIIEFVNHFKYYYMILSINGKYMIKKNHPDNKELLLKGSFNKEKNKKIVLIYKFIY